MMCCDAQGCDLHFDESDRKELDYVSITYAVRLEIFLAYRNE